MTLHVSNERKGNDYIAFLVYSVQKATLIISYIRVVIVSPHFSSHDLKMLVMLRIIGAIVFLGSWLILLSLSVIPQQQSKIGADLNPESTRRHPKPQVANDPFALAYSMIAKQ